MSRGSRARRYLRLAVLYACVIITASKEYGVPIEIKLWDTGRSPMAHMVDVTNGFGLKVLAEHNFLNDNNIAFSPYGLMGIMVALYEGVDGESSYQIQRGMQLPWNRNVMRIGFRDIHRTLKTYFVPEEGFLAGLALNNENVTFNDNYKKILRFYGFDLENDQLPTTPPTNVTSNETTTVGPTTPATSTAGSTAGGLIDTENKDKTTSTRDKEETTLNPNAETIPIDSRAPTESTTASPSSAPNAEITTTTTSMLTTTETAAPTEITTQKITTTSPQETTTQQITTTSPQETTTQQILTTTSLQTTQELPITTNPSTTVESTTQTVMQSMETDAETISQQTSQAMTSQAMTSQTTSQQTSSDDPITNEVSLSTIDMGSSASETWTDTSTISMTATESVMTTFMTETNTEQASTAEDMSTTAATNTLTTESSLETLQRRKKSIVDFIFTNPPYIDDYFFYRSYQIGPDVAGGYDDKMFLANGLKSVQVTYMHYDTVLEYAHLPHLEASALRLPLDSERYYLLVVLPDRGGNIELGRLLGRMARESDLADVYAALRPRRVRAIVPSFMVKGHVTLTTDLQKVGIRDVFEPRQRDFTPMTRQPGVYVRSIEQAVSVAIRKYQPDDHKKNRYVSKRDQVRFYATYPFLYFVMDASIHVALMAGKMVDPLNSRIL